MPTKPKSIDSGITTTTTMRRTKVSKEQKKDDRDQDSGFQQVARHGSNGCR